MRNKNLYISHFPFFKDLFILDREQENGKFSVERKSVSRQRSRGRREKEGKESGADSVLSMQPNLRGSAGLNVGLSVGLHPTTLRS